jgi:putative flippase GtrA
MPPIGKPFFRYGVVGFANNAGGYLIYLLVTWFGVDPKLMVTIGYPIGALVGYFGNKQWSFSYKGRITPSLARYIMAHVGGYLINISMLYILVDRLGLTHQWVQMVAIFVVAGFLFLAMRFFVFPVSDRNLEDDAASTRH